MMCAQGSPPVADFGNHEVGTIDIAKSVFQVHGVDGTGAVKANVKRRERELENLRAATRKGDGYVPSGPPLPLAESF
jgi:hypothetical protein